MTSPTDPNHPANSARASRSAGGLASDVVRHGSNLVQQEIQLAKAEMSEKASQLKAAIGELIAGTVLLMVSLGVLLSALVSGIARLLVGLFGDDPTAAREVVALEGLDEGQVQMVTAVNQNVEAALDAARTLPTYEGLAALLVGVVFAIVGALLLRNGLSKLDPGNLVPDRTIRQVRKDGEMARDQV
ncbi:phage holin family protein [uncultured Jannaschia sp.]|uniref:phage holin family protein n=1 Tax=uncultured Jannaschia sp. TaxID=293347 RepID=UPI0026127F7C|nr:phage holin family protein [uncultured Jannaschia sp.]